MQRSDDSPAMHGQSGRPAGGDGGWGSGGVCCLPYLASPVLDQVERLQRGHDVGLLDERRRRHLLHLQMHTASNPRSTSQAWIGQQNGQAQGAHGRVRHLLGAFLFPEQLDQHLCPVALVRELAQIGKRPAHSNQQPISPAGAAKTRPKGSAEHGERTAPACPPSARPWTAHTRMR